MGTEARNNLFYKGRDEGLGIALRILEGGGDAESIRKEIMFRERTGITIGLSNEELDKASRKVKALTVGTMKIAFAAAVSDSYGFGPKRLRKVLDSFEKLTEYMDNGWLYWLDMVEELKARYKIDLSIEEGETMLRHYSHPASDDLWEEPDLVRKPDWDCVLKETGFTEGVSKDGNPCIFDGPVPLLEYHDEYEKVDAFCMLQGVLLERERREKEEARAAKKVGPVKEAPSEEPEAEPKTEAKPKPKPERKGKRHGRKKR